MPRIPNVRPTNIYWLFDMRPETLAVHPLGWPFYCGKTVLNVAHRLSNHRHYAFTHPNRKLSEKLAECGDHVRIEAMEIVPPEISWSDRERFWIYSLRTLYPGCLNVSDGGAGAPGNVHSVETRKKISTAHKGKKFSAETVAKMVAWRKGRSLSPEHRAKLSAALKGRKRDAEHCAKLSAALTGKKGVKPSAETRAKRSASLKGRIISPEHRAKIAASNTGKTRSAESRAKMSASRMGKKRGPMSDEHRAAISAAHIVRFQKRRIANANPL